MSAKSWPRAVSCWLPCCEPASYHYRAHSHSREAASLYQEYCPIPCTAHDGLPCKPCENRIAYISLIRCMTTFRKSMDNTLQLHENTKSLHQMFACAWCAHISPDMHTVELNNMKMVSLHSFLSIFFWQFSYYLTHFSHISHMAHTLWTWRHVVNMSACIHA